MMDKITSQLDIITRSVVILAKRIGDNEDLVNEAYHAYKVHQRNAEIRENIAFAKMSLQGNEKVEGEGGDEQDRLKNTANDLEETRQKVKNIMNIINVSQYSLAAVQRSAQEVKDETTKLKEELTPSKNTNTMRSPIVEESEDDFDREG